MQVLHGGTQHQCGYRARETHNLSYPFPRAARKDELSIEGVLGLKRPTCTLKVVHVTSVEACMGHHNKLASPMLLYSGQLPA